MDSLIIGIGQASVNNDLRAEGKGLESDTELSERVWEQNDGAEADRAL